MMRRTLVELARTVGGQVRGDGGRIACGVAIDSRSVESGNLFVALPGARVDGHDFVAQAGARGAAAAVVARPVEHPLPQLVVGDTLAALQAIAKAERERGTYRLVAVTGSIGKTTTKEFLAALMAARFEVGLTAGNRNSESGFPVELCNQRDGISWMVAELGMSHAGELDRLGAIARPDALLYTVVAPVHLEFFPDIEAIAEAKAELIRHLATDGVLVLNAADPRVAAFARRFAGRIVQYGREDASGYWLQRYESRGLLGARFVLRGPGFAIEVDWPTPGRHQADNVLAAAACAITLGVPPEAVPVIAARLQAPHRRGGVHELANGVSVIDDSYNASPEAVKRLLELFAETPGRRVAVLGEMLELGARAIELHREVGVAARAVAHVIVAVGGPAAAALAEAAGTVARHVADADAALVVLRAILQPGDVVLIKGSRGIGLDRVVDGILSEAA